MILTYKGNSINADKVSSIQSNKPGIITITDVNNFCIEYEYDIRKEIAMMLINTIVSKSDIRYVFDLSKLDATNIKETIRKDLEIYNSSLFNMKLENVREQYIRRKEIEDEEKKRFMEGDSEYIHPISSSKLLIDSSVSSSFFNEGGENIVTLLTMYFNSTLDIKCYIRIPYSNLRGFIEFDIEENNCKTIEDVMKYIKGEKEFKCCQ